MNMDNLAEAIELQGAMKGIAIDARAEFIKLDNKNKKFKANQKKDLDKKGKEQATKIVQIYSAWDSAARACALC